MRRSYLIPQLKVTVEFYEGKPISVELPATVDLTVVETEPGLKGATVSNVTKPAKIETGLVVQVPPFITERREDPRQHRRRHVPGTRLKRAARGPPLPPRTPFADHSSRFPFDARDHRRGRSPQASFRGCHTSAQLDAISQVGMRLLRSRAAADHGRPGYQFRGASAGCPRQQALARVRGSSARLAGSCASAGTCSQRSSSRFRSVLSSAW